MIETSSSMFDTHISSNLCLKAGWKILQKNKLITLIKKKQTKLHFWGQLYPNEKILSKEGHCFIENRLQQFFYSYYLLNAAIKTSP